MDVFELRGQVIDDYASYVRSFFTIRNPRVETLIENALTDGQLWPDPLLQLSPSFEPGETLDELIAAGELHGEARRIFAVKSEDGTLRMPLRLHRHQVEGIRAARAGASYATALGSTEAMLVYPRPVTPVRVQAGPVHVRTLGVDLSKLPATDVAPFLSWAAPLSRSAG